MSKLRILLVAGALALGSLATAAVAAAAPVAPPVKVETTGDVVNVRVVCDRSSCERGGDHRRRHYEDRRPHYDSRHRYYEGRRRYYDAPRRVYVAPRIYVRPRPIYIDPYPVYVQPRRVIVRRSYDAHVRWCLARYGSYNPRTDRFLAYDGRYKFCQSPYR